MTKVKKNKKRKVFEVLKKGQGVCKTVYGRECVWGKA